MKKFVFIFFLIPMGLYGQSLENWVIGSGGEIATGSGIQLSWTLGEPNTATISKNGHMFTEGFHQSYLEVKELIYLTPLLSNLKIQVYPNPAADHVQVNFSDKLARDFDLRLLDSKGKLLQFQQYQSTNQAQLSLQGLPASTYLISIQINDQAPSLPHSFQIIKH